jgi:hypothetical protein
VPRATAALNTIRQVGASIGTALAAVLLESRASDDMPGSSGASVLAPLPPAARERLAGPLADAFGDAFMWIVVATALAIVSGVALTMAERRTRAGRSPAVLVAERQRGADPGAAAGRAVDA